MRRNTRLVTALDLRDPEEALGVAEAVAPFSDALKVNLGLVLTHGMEVVDRLSDFGYVLCDFKLADPPFTNRWIVEEVFRHRASGIIVHGFPGEDAVRACVEAARGDVFVLASMSHPGGAQFLLPVADDLARLAVKAGAAGIVAGATRPEVIARLRRGVGDLLILAPGVGPQGGSATEAIRHGADLLIVGRRITRSPDPAASARDVVAEIEAAVERPAAQGRD